MADRRIATREMSEGQGGDRAHTRFHPGRDSAKREALPKFVVEPLRDLARKQFEYTADQSAKLTFTRDNNGKIYIQDEMREFDSGIGQIKDADPKRYAKLEHEIIKNAVSKFFKIDKRDLNGLTVKNGVYSFYDRKGNPHEISRTDYPGQEAQFDQKRKEIERQITALGFKADSISMPDNIKENLLKHAADQEPDAEKKSVEDGIIHSYRYNKIDGQLKLNIVPRDTMTSGEKLDRDMKEVSIDPKSLSSEVRKGLEYYETKQAIKDEYGLMNDDIHNVIIFDGKIHINTKDGETTYTFKADPIRMNNIKERLAEKGFHYNEQQISDSVRGTALQHAIDKETNLAKKAALKDATIYDYIYDKKSNKHIYHVLTKEISPDGTGGIEVRDGKMEKVSFTHEEHKKLLKDATLKAVEKFGELPGGKKITEGMVDFAPNDKTKFVVTDPTDGGKHTLTGDSNLSDGRKLKDAIASELNVKPRVETGILTEKSTDILIGTQGTDSKLEALEKELEGYENWTNHLLRTLNAAAWFNTQLSQVGNDFENLVGAIMHESANSDQQQQPGSSPTDMVNSLIDDHFKHHRKLLKKQIELLKKNSGSLKGSNAGKMIERIRDQEERLKNSPHLSQQKKDELLSNDSDDE